MTHPSLATVVPSGRTLERLVPLIPASWGPRRHVPLSDLRPTLWDLLRGRTEAWMEAADLALEDLETAGVAEGRIAEVIARVGPRRPAGYRLVEAYFIQWDQIRVRLDVWGWRKPAPRPVTTCAPAFDYRCTRCGLLKSEAGPVRAPMGCLDGRAFVYCQAPVEGIHER